ncbi:curli production assembly/transport protein CsgE [Pseudomonas sp. NyZ704]|nr:curli production assembly/transport protein CsgE [Pseudomonas sp. NyZ704]
MRKILLLCLLMGFEVNADEAELQGFIVDNTITRTGHEFYRAFSGRLNATSALDFNLVVKERPSARWGVLVWVEQDNNVLYRQFLQPNMADMQSIGDNAADMVLQEIERKKVEALFDDNTDMAKDEI